MMPYVTVMKLKNMAGTLASSGVVTEIHATQVANSAIIMPPKRRMTSYWLAV